MVLERAAYRVRMLGSLIIVIVSCSTIAIAGEDLLKAALHGDLPEVKHLLAKGADVNEKGPEGQTALMMACATGKKEVVEVLLAKGADVNARSSDGHTALMFDGLGNGNKEVVQLLLDKGADVNAKTNKGATALYFESLIGHKDSVPLLLDKGADVNAKIFDGTTALMVASVTGQAEIVRMLLDKGADVNAKTNYGGTALSVAKGNKVRELLLNHSEKTEYYDTKGTIAMASVQLDQSKSYFLLNYLLSLKEYPDILFATSVASAESDKLISENVLMQLKNHEVMTSLFGGRREDATIYDTEAIGKKIQIQHNKNNIGNDAIPTYRIIRMKLLKDPEITDKGTLKGASRGVNKNPSSGKR
jgi:uncharacterized protein